jgi:protein-L-isoaspartate O-methyltransferase
MIQGWSCDAHLLAAMLLLSSPDAGGHGHGGHGRHGNPEDLAAYIAKRESPPDRDQWQKPAEVLEALAVKPGQVVCDIGAGPGYFALKLARAVGEKGAVFAMDVGPRILEVLRDGIEKSGVRNVVPVLALDGDPLMPPASRLDAEMTARLREVQQLIERLRPRAK